MNTRVYTVGKVSILLLITDKIVYKVNLAPSLGNNALKDSLTCFEGKGDRNKAIMNYLEKERSEVCGKFIDIPDRYGRHLIQHANHMDTSDTDILPAAGKAILFYSAIKPDDDEE